MTPVEKARIHEIWAELDFAGDLRGLTTRDKVQVIASRVVAEIGPHITTHDLAAIAAERADALDETLAQILASKRRLDN